MRWRWLIEGLLLIICAAVLARADITVTQFFSNPSAGHADANRVAKFNADGKQNDFHDSQIIQWPAGTNNYYRYSEQYGCGSVLHNFGSWCGIYVWYSTDLGADGGPGWQLIGTLFDPNSGTWQTRCNPASAASGGCWTFRMVRNAANSNWVAWMHDPSGSGNPAVFICTSLTGGCTEQARPTGLAGGCTGVDTVYLFVDNDATAYLTYTCQTTPFSIHIDKLNTNYTDSTGATVAPASITNTEGQTLFRLGSTYYLVYAGACPYCDGVAVNYATASTPLGTWTTQGQINADGCNGQHEGLDKITIAGTDYYLFHSDLWTNQVGGSFQNQALAMEMLVPLTFTSGAINTIPCNTSFTITNAGITAAPSQPALVPIADQTDETSSFTPYCDINNTIYRMQTFVPGFSASNIWARNTTAQNLNACTFDITTCSKIDGNLLVDLVTLDGSKNPVTQLASTTITPNDVAWRLTSVLVQLAGSVTSGTEYGLRMRGTNTVGCWAWGYNDNLPYAAGVARVSTDSGSTWTTTTNRSMRFGVAKTSAGLSGIGASVH
jgi:hypothetical protein